MHAKPSARAHTAAPHCQQLRVVLTLHFLWRQAVVDDDAAAAGEFDRLAGDAARPLPATDGAAARALPSPRTDTLATDALTPRRSTGQADRTPSKARPASNPFAPWSMLRALLTLQANSRQR